MQQVLLTNYKLYWTRNIITKNISHLTFNFYLTWNVPLIWLHKQINVFSLI